MAPVRVLYVGTFPPPEGGVRVLVRQLAQGLESDPRLEVECVDLTAPPGRPAAAHLAKCTASVARRIRRADVVMLSAPTNYHVRWGPVAVGLATAAQTPLVVRLFAGSQRIRHRARPAWQRALLEETVFSGDLLFIETQADVTWFAEHVSAPVQWLPNNRQAPELPDRTPRERASRFVFLGSVNEEKGVLLMIEAARRLAAEGLDIQIDLYGKDHMDVESALDGATNITFHGLLEHRLVYETLAACDALLLPSYREGYPGVLIEAFMVGLPVIATRLEGISEMTEEGVDALLMEPGDVDGLVQAMRVLHQQPRTYADLCTGAAEARHRYSAETWNARVGDLLVEVAESRGGRYDQGPGLSSE